MGTRHSQTVIDKDGNLKLRQYGQWDGYPAGQGLDILKFLLSCDLDEYQRQLDNIHEMNLGEEKEYDKFMKSIGVTDGWMNMEQSKKFQEKYFFLSRDCGSRIHKLILRGKVPFVEIMGDLDAKQSCEGFYTIDFKKRKFTSKFHSTTRSFSLDNLPTIEEYLTKMRVKKSQIKDILEREAKDQETKKPKTAKAIAKGIIDMLKGGDKVKQIHDIKDYSDDLVYNSSFRFDTTNKYYNICNTPSVKVSKEVIEILKQANLVL